MTIVNKAKFIGTVLIGGAKTQLKQEWVWGLAAVVGLQQGLKYKGSIKTGIAGGTAVLAVLSGANALWNVASEWDKIQQIFKEE